MALILPKGLVVNSPGISADLVKRATQPLTTDELFELWRVYTTTKRRLIDPTAERLENLFWRIWGSRRRQLSSLAVSYIFADISAGNTYAGIEPLRSSMKRDESGVPLKGNGRLISAVSSTHSKPDVPQLSSRTSKTSAGKKPARKVLTTLGNGITAPALQYNATIDSGQLSPTILIPLLPSPVSPTMRVLPPMPPPILKKSRGQSSNGPKPTARFVSPGISEDERNKTAIEDEHSPSSHVVIRPPTPERRPSDDRRPREPHVHHRKKAHGHVVASVGHRRRPGLSHRPTSQSSNGSTGSESSTKRLSDAGFYDNTGDIPIEATPSSQDSRKSRSSLSQQSSSRFQENFSPSPENKHVTKALSNSRGPKPRSEMQSSSRTSAPTLRSDKGKQPMKSSAALPDASLDTSPERVAEGSSRKSFKIKAGTTANPQAGGSLPRQHPSNESNDIVDANQAAELNQWDKQSKPLGHSSKHSMSAINISAAYHTTGRSVNDHALAQASTDFASAKFDMPQQASLDMPDQRQSSPSKVKQIINAGTSSFFSRKSLLSGSPSVASPVPASYISSSSFTNKMPSRSVTNLAMLLQKDDEMKAKSRERKSSDH